MNSSPFPSLKMNDFLLATAVAAVVLFALGYLLFSCLDKTLQLNLLRNQLIIHCDLY